MEKFPIFKYFSFSKSETGKFLVLVDKGDLTSYDSLDEFLDFFVNYIKSI